MIEDRISELFSEVCKQLQDARSVADLEAVRVHAFGKSGVITKLLSQIRDVDPSERKTFGAKVNEVKDKISQQIDLKKSELKRIQIENRIKNEQLDVTIPVNPMLPGKLHPVSCVIEEIEDIFHSMGFQVETGNEIEDVYYNFTAANIPDYHPARQMHDTFYIKGQEEKVLRTHTTPIQIHSMLSRGAPLRIIAPGRVFRSDYDSTHTPVFHQVEGLVIDKNINFCNLVWCLKTFFKRFFDINDLELRIRPSYFPFTEPSAEADIKYMMKNGRMVLGKGDMFLEVVGCGMVHPQVLRNGGIDPEKFTGFAFGFGVERLASLKYGIPDLRGYFEIDRNWKDTFGMSPFC